LRIDFVAGDSIVLALVGECWDDWICRREAQISRRA
jgi:hypothetical protein